MSGSLACAAAALISFLAYRRHSLTASGALSAALLGTIVVVAGGWWWGALLVTFFVTSSALSKTRRSRPDPIAARGQRRDAIQVLANGGVAGFCALLAAIGHRDLFFAAFAGVIAAATADTWATELGRFSRRPPRLLTTGRVVNAGTSGAVSLLGSLASLLGALSIGALATGIVALGLTDYSPRPLALGFAVSAAGMAGSLTDSLLGATLQAAYTCPACGLTIEARHHCQTTPTLLTRGQHWFTNDVVNGFATLTGALLAASVVVITR